MNTTTHLSTLNETQILSAYLDSKERLVSAAEMKQFAEMVCESPVALGRYLNMLSVLEFVGTRALINTFANQMETNDNNLKHVLEEARHSLLLRKMGERVARRTLDYDDNSVFSNLSANYFIKRMIACVHNDLYRHPELVADQDLRHRLVILYCSGVLEVRAVWWYTIFNKEIAEKRYEVNFKQVLTDEEGHISSLEEEIRQIDAANYSQRLKKYFAKEEELFARYFEVQRQHLRTAANA